MRLSARDMGWLADGDEGSNGRLTIAARRDAGGIEEAVVAIEAYVRGVWTAWAGQRPKVEDWIRVGRLGWSGPSGGTVAGAPRGRQAGAPSARIGLSSVTVVEYSNWPWMHIMPIALWRRPISTVIVVTPFAVVTSTDLRLLQGWAPAS